MAIRIDFPEDLEKRLREAAARCGQGPAEYVRELVKENLLLAELQALKDRPRPRSLEELRPRIAPPAGSTGIAHVFGQWPGDESDEEIGRLLEEIS